MPAPGLSSGPSPAAWRWQVGAAWERAVARLKSVLDDAFQGATAAAAMLTVKDFMLLVCLALGGWGEGEERLLGRFHARKCCVYAGMGWRVGRPQWIGTGVGQVQAEGHGKVHALCAATYGSLMACNFQLPLAAVTCASFMSAWATAFWPPPFLPYSPSASIRGGPAMTMLFTVQRCIGKFNDEAPWTPTPAANPTRRCHCEPSSPPPALHAAPVAEQCGYHSVAVREILMNGRAKYHDLLGAATAEAVQVGDNYMGTLCADK